LLHDLPKEAGYAHGINPGLVLYEKCKECGIREASIYCFTQDNTKRPSIQKQAFIEATFAFAFEIARRGAALLVVGDETSTQFPSALKEFRKRQCAGIKVNLLVNYGWEWDLDGLKSGVSLCKSTSNLELSSKNLHILPMIEISRNHF
jgi:undecaprenyl diphosphate synthase